jgi:nucleoside-diphosphate-sugar epimerase
MNFFFFGMGYSSLATARAIHTLVDPAATIAGTTRNADNAGVLAYSSIRVHVFNGTEPGHTLTQDLLRASHVVVSIAPDEHGDPVLAHQRDTLDAAKNLQWLCYFSTVGVYGNFDGAWIDETAPRQPLNQRSRQRMLAEDAWRAYAGQRAIPLLILRLAGIYGPGRSSFDKLKDGTARRIVKPGQVFNRIHVDDIGRITALAAERRLSGIFNLADDEPAPPQDLITHAAAMMGIAPPPETPFDEAQMTPMARSFYSDNKRVSNAAIKAALGIELLYPTYREGLSSLYGAL